MTSSFALPRIILIYAVVLPLAALIGYLLASPDSFTSHAMVGLVVLGLSAPLLLRWHHLLLLLSWNAIINLYFLPGAPDLWMILAGISLVISTLDRVLTKKESETYVPSIVLPLLFLVLVTLVTAKFTQGIGMRALGGGTFGGKRYVYVLAAVIGYFALSNQAVPRERAARYAGWFFLSGIMAMTSNLVYMVGPAFYFLYYFFPAVFAFQQAMADYTVAGTPIARLTGLAFAAPAVVNYLLLKFGLRGLFSVARPWRLLLLLATMFAGMLGGFRSTVIMFGLLMVLMFICEGLYRTRLMVWVVAVGVVGMALLVPLADRLPMPVQRSLSFLPVAIHPHAKADAMGTADWRLRMWMVLLPEVPKYLWLGKGFALNPADYYLIQESVKRGLAQDIDLPITGGSYHSGPLTLMIPLGIWGAIGFLWFAVAALRVLHRNWRHGPPELKLVNTFLMAYFWMRFIYFLVFYGQFAEDLVVFTGIVGLSVSLNHGMCKAPEPGQAPATASEPAPAPAAAG